MTQQIDIEALRDEALRKLGRNVVNFQKVEVCLKFLIAVSDVQGTPKDLTAHQAKKAASIRKKSLGTLAEAFHRNLCGPGATSEAPAELLEPWLSISMKVDADASTIKQRKRALSTLVAERNKLIHHDLLGFDQNSANSCRDLINVLDPQNERILRQLDELKLLIDTFREHIEDLQAWVDSDDFLSQFPSGPEQRLSRCGRTGG